MNTQPGKAVRLPVILFVVLLLSPILALAAYEENIREDIYLVRPDNQYMAQTSVPTYLENEDLTFFACVETESTPLRLSVLCDDTNEFADIPAYKWGPENCYIGSINLEQFACSNAYARAEYVQGEENMLLEQEIRINTFTQTLNRIVETQFTDGGWQGALDTAYGLFAISFYPDLFEERINEAIEYLKINRDDTDKCWPQEDCQISTTANILFLLNKAGFEDLRIQRDGQIYLEREQNYLSSNSQWNLTITDHVINLNNSINTSCVYDYDNNIETFTLPRNPQTIHRQVNPDYGKTINVVCTEPVFVDLYNEFEEELINYQGDNFTYEIPQPCWTLNNERINCDVRTTLFASGSPLIQAQKSAAQNYLSQLLVDDRTAGKHVQENWTLINDALYAQVQNTNVNDVIRGLLYQQANNGSWDSNRLYYPYSYYEATQEEREEKSQRLNDTVTRSIVNTGYVVMTLLENNFEFDDEPVLDAQRYISLMESETGQNISDEQLTDAEFVEAYEENRTSILTDPKRNAMALYVLQNNARPIIRTQPAILLLNTPQTTVDFINPTVFDLEELEYEISDSLQSKIRVEEKDYVGAFSFRRIGIEVLDDSTQEFGYLRLKKNDDEYLKLPIIIDQQPELEITLPETLTVFGGRTTLPFTVEKSTHNFTCSLAWGVGGISSAASFNINNVNNQTYNYPVRFSAIETENSVYNGTITCESNQVTFITDFATNIQRFSSRPIQVNPQSISITDSSNYPIQITNLLDRDIEVTASMRDNSPLAVISENYFTLLPGESTNITLQYVPVSGENLTQTNSLVFSSFNIEERVLVDVEIYPEPPREWGVFDIVLIVSTVITLVMFSLAAYKKREEIQEWYQKRFHKEDIRKQVQEQIAQIEAQEQREAIRNLMRIGKLQGKKDAEVRELIVSQGYTDNDIEDALKAKSQETTSTSDQDKQ